MKFYQLLFLSLLVKPSYGQTITLRSIHEAMSKAQQQNLTIKQSEIQRKLARTDQQSGVSGYLPALSLSASSDYNLNLPVQLIPSEFFGGKPGTYQEARFGRDWNSTASIDFTQPLIHADKYAQIQASKYSRQQTDLEQDNQQRIVLQRVAQSYLNVLVLQESVMLNQELDSSALALYSSSKARFDRKLISTVDMNRVENLLHQTRQQTLQLEGNLAIAKRNLSALLGLSSGNEIEILDRISAYQEGPNQFQTNEQVTASNRLSVKSALAAEQAASWRYRQQKWSMFPKLSLNSRYTFANQGDTWLGAGSNAFDYGSVGINLSVPLFKGRSTALNSRKAYWQLESAHLQKEQALLNASQELDEWQIRLKEKREASKLATRRDEMARQTLQLSFQNYEQGVITLDALFSIYGEYVAARNNYLMSIADVTLYSAYLSLEK